MMGPFNFEHCKCWMQGMLNPGQSSGCSWTPEEKISKMWEARAKFISFMADMSSALGENMAELAQKQAEIVRKNAESCADLCRKNSQSMPTHQEMIEKFKDGAERNMQDAKELADICAKANTRLFDAYKSRFSCGCINCNCGAKESQTVNAKPTKKTTKK